MTALSLPVAAAQNRWVLALDPKSYDRRAELSAGKRAALLELHRSPTRWRTELSSAVARLTEPIDDVLAVVTPHTAWWGRYPARRALVAGMARGTDAFWGWDRYRWLTVLGDSDAQIRQLVMAVAYLLCDQRDLHLAFRGFKTGKFAGRVFGTEPVDGAVSRVAVHLDELGYAARLGRPNMQRALLDAMLLVGSPLLEDIAERSDLLVWLRSRDVNNARRYGVEQLARTLVDMRVLERMPFATQPSREEWLARSQAAEIDVPAMWLAWTRRWFETSTLSASTRTHTYYGLIKAGRWLEREHPDRAEPSAWDRELVAAWVAAVDRMRVGEFSKSQNSNYMRARYGGPLGPRSKAALIWSLRTFFRDIQEVGVDRAALRCASRVRVAARDQGADRPGPARDRRRGLGEADVGRAEPDRRGPPVHRACGPWYPLELVQAVALLWLFSGLRTDEMLRLRIGSIRWQHDTGKNGAQRAVCLLDVPTNKTGTAFTKPVDRTVGEAIERWEAARPSQPKFEDRKTGEPVDMLLAYRGAQVGAKYLNRVLIPLLCERQACRARTSAGRSLAIGRARRSLASSTTPRSPCRCSSCRRGSGTAPRTPPSITRGSPRSR